MASGPSQSDWLAARLKRRRRPTLMEQGQTDAPAHRAHQFPASALAQIGEADRDDQKGFEAFAEGDDERLNHEHDWTESTN